MCLSSAGPENIHIPVCAGYFNGDILFDVTGLPREPGAVPDYVANCFAILTRGMPSRPTPQLLAHFGCRWQDLQHAPLWLIANSSPYWGESIRGNDQGNNPALAFFAEIMPEYLGRWTFIQNLIVPEYPLFRELGAPRNLVREDNSERVDFYLPQAELVIEIDGGQHKSARQTAKDNERERFLERYGIETLRLKTEDLRSKNAHFTDFIDRLKLHCENSSLLSAYHHFLATAQDSTPSLRYDLTATLRLQVALILAVACGCLDLSAPEWRLHVTQDFPENQGNTWVNFAVDELFSWFELFARLNHTTFTRPDIIFSSDGLHFAMRLFQRADDNAASDQGIGIYTGAVQYLPFCYGEEKSKKKIRIRSGSKSYLITEKAAKQQQNAVLPALADLRELNYRIFGHDSFRPGQETLILNALSGQKSLGLMPTGGGKSLCFQIPALLSQGTTIVVVPIKALGRDHCAELEAVGFTGRTVNIDSNMPAVLRDKIYFRRILSGEMRFVFVSPERFQTESFRRIIDSLRQAEQLRMFVIDEVHCMSEWGHDFRPSYLTLPGTLRKLAKDVPLIGLTATASVNVLRDIQSEFQIPDELVAYEMHRGRTELNFSIRKNKSSAEVVVQEVMNILAKQTETGSPPIHIFSPYANGVNGVEFLSNALADAKGDLKIGFFSGAAPRNFNPDKAWQRLQDSHLMASPDYERYKKTVQAFWKQGKLDVIVTTKAFGMGVNKPDVRHTLHAGMPGSMEAFYQEAGRAGRDRRPAVCHMLFQPESDDAEHIWLRLQANLTPEAVQKEIDARSQNSRGDFRSQLWFLRQGLISLEEEQALLARLHTLVREWSQEIQVIHVRQLSEVPQNGLRFQLTLFRLYQMGIIEPWTVTDWGRGGAEELSVQAVEVRRLNTSFVDACSAVMLRIQSVDGKGAESATLEKLKALAKQKENWPGLYQLLLAWVRRTQLGSRLQSTWNLYNACLNFTPEQAVVFRDTLESFFKVDSNAFRLASLRDMPLNEAAVALNSLITVNGTHELPDRMLLNKLAAQLARLLEGTQESRGLNLAAACLQLLTEQASTNEASRRFRQAVPDDVLSFWHGAGGLLLSRVGRANASAGETIGGWLLNEKPARHELLAIHNALPAKVIEAALFHEVAAELAQIL